MSRLGAATPSCSHMATELQGLGSDLSVLSKVRKIFCSHKINLKTLDSDFIKIRNSFKVFLDFFFLQKQESESNTCNKSATRGQRASYLATEALQINKEHFKETGAKA